LRLRQPSPAHPNRNKLINSYGDEGAHRHKLTNRNQITHTNRHKYSDEDIDADPHRYASSANGHRHGDPAANSYANRDASYHSSRASCSALKPDDWRHVDKPG